MLRSLLIGVLLLAYLAGGLVPLLFMQGWRVGAAADAPLPYQHSATWHARYHAQLDCWDRCNGDQGRALLAAARVKSRPAAPPPRPVGMDFHLPSAPVASLTAPRPIVPKRVPTTLQRPDDPCAGVRREVALPPEAHTA